MPERKSRRKRTSKKEKKRTRTDVGIKVDALIAEDMWKRTFDNVPDLMAVLDKEHRIVQVNKSMAQRLGTTPERCVGLNCFRCMHKLDVPPSFCPHSLTLADGKEHVAEIHEPNLGGDFIVSTTPLFDDEGKIIGSVHVARDITERKKAEEEIKALSCFPSENPNPVLRISKDGNLLYHNDASLPIVNEWKCQVGQPVPGKWRQLVTDVFESGIKKDFKDEYATRTFVITLAPVADEEYANVYGRDITERKQAEKALHQSEEIYRGIVETAQEGIMVANPEGKIVLANERIAQVLGYTVDELIGKSGLELVSEKEKTKAQERLMSRKKGIKEQYEVWMRGKDGSEVCLLASGAPLFDVEGLHIGNLGMYTDITERKKTEEGLKQSERQFKSLAVNAPDVIMRFDPNLRIQYLNPQVERSTGIPVAQWIGKTNEEMGMSPELCKLWNDMFHKAESSKQLQQAEFDFPSSDGTRTFSLRVVPEYAEDGSLTSFLGISHDITDIKKAEEELRKARDELELRVEERTKELSLASEKVKAERKRFFDVLEKLPAYMVLLTPDYHVRYANRFFRERFGEDKGRRCFEYLFSRSEPCEPCETYKTLKKMGPLEWEWAGPDGHNYYIFDSPFIDVDGSTLIMEVGIDITERKKAEEKLHELSLYSRSLIEASLDPLVTINTEGKITDVNKATEETTGFSRGQLIGSDFTNYFTDPEEARKGYRRVFAEGLVRDYPLAIRHESGKTTDVLYNATVYRNEAGEIQGILAAARDITERKKAEKALRKAHDELESRVEERTRELKDATWRLQADIMERQKAEDKLRETTDYLDNLLNYANAPIIVWDPEFKITKFNHAFEHLSGYKAEEVLGKHLSMFFPEESREASLTEIQHTSAGEYWESVEIPILHKDGDVRTALWNSANIHAADGKTLMATIAQGQDITERKKAEQAVMESQIDLNRAQAVAMTGSWRLDVGDNILRWSDETYRMFEIPKGTPMTYETFLSFVHPDDQEYVDQQWQAAMKGEPYDIEHRIIVNGKVKWVREKAELEFDKNGLFLGGFGTVQDVTERREMHAKLEEYSMNLEQLVEQKTQELNEAQRLVTIGETAAMVGHDIRNPLQSIEGAVYLAREELKTLPDGSSEKKELNEILEMIRHQTNYIDHIVADLQDYSRTPFPQLREADLHELVRDAISMIEIPDDIQAQTVMQDDLRLVTVDPVFMKRVLLNLIENAVHAMPNGGKLTVKAFQEGGGTCIHVEDTGICIPEENRSKIFTPLFTTKAKGQGFGLAVCKKLIEAHHGEITFESEVGRGTIFKIRLPKRKETS